MNNKKEFPPIYIKTRLDLSLFKKKKKKKKSDINLELSAYLPYRKLDFQKIYQGFHTPIYIYIFDKGASAVLLCYCFFYFLGKERFF